MKILTLSLLPCLLSAATAFAADSPTADGTAIQISDIPRGTQMGSPPAPEGAPGRGRYFPPMPADPKLPTLWIIGDSTVRNGTLGDGSNPTAMGLGRADRGVFRSG